MATPSLESAMGLFLVLAGSILMFLGKPWPPRIEKSIALYLHGAIYEPSPLTPDKVAIPIKDFDALTIYMDGRVEFGPGFTADDAAKAFWKKVGEVAPR